jgi:hypothetical protein
MADNADGLADFILGLPEGERHKGFFWAAKTAAEDQLPPAEVAKVADAGVKSGLDETYVHRTITEAREGSRRGKADPHQEA